MKTVFIPFAAFALLSGCAATHEGAEVSEPPPAVQGAGDAQGGPIYSGPAPSVGIGIGIGRWGGRGGAGVGIGYGW